MKKKQSTKKDVQLRKKKQRGKRKFQETFLVLILLAFTFFFIVEYVDLRRARKGKGETLAVLQEGVMFLFLLPKRTFRRIIFVLLLPLFFLLNKCVKKGDYTAPSILYNSLANSTAFGEVGRAPHTRCTSSFVTSFFSVSSFTIAVIFS